MPLFAAGWPVPLVILSIVAAVVAVTDLRSRRIPNVVVLPAIVAVLFIEFQAYGLGAGLAPAAGGAAVGLLVTLPMYALRALGAGDAKLLMLVGAALGATGVLQVAALSIVIAAAMGVAGSCLGGRLRLFLSNLQVGTLLLLSANYRSAATVASGTAYRVPFALAVALALPVWLRFFW
jgi:prepilin peptidase CpaA